MFSARLSLLTVAGLLVLLSACASAPTGGDVSESNEPAPELNLVLPDQTAGACVRDEGVDYTFLDKGFSALVAGDHIEAVKYFQRYARLELTPAAEWEAGIAIAYDSMLPQSPFYDPRAARKAYQQLQKQQPEEGQFHEQVLMMRDALATFVALARQINELQSDKAILSEDLEKREEALRRLRELTLGQKGAAP